MAHDSTAMLQQLIEAQPEPVRTRIAHRTRFYKHEIASQAARVEQAEGDECKAKSQARLRMMQDHCAE